MADIVIVGGGIAGLSAAWELSRRGYRPLVLEQTARPGGVIRTERLAGFVIDAGPDSLLTQKPAAIELCRELGLGERLLPTLPPRTAFVVRDGKLVPLPEASFLGFPTRLRPFVRSPLFSWRAKMRMGLEVLVPPRRDTRDESIGDFVRRRFGREAVRYLAEPLLAGIHSGDVDQLSMQALFPRMIEMERTHGSVLRALARSPARPSTEGAFQSLPGGLEELVVTLVSKLPSDMIRCGSTVISVEEGKPFLITTNRGERIQAAVVILAAPAWAVSSMVAPLDRELSQLIGRIAYASSATVAIGLRRDQIGHPLDGTGFVVPRCERRTLMAATWVSAKWPQRAPEGYALLRGFVGGANDPDALSATDSTIAGAAFSELSSLLDISGEPLFSRVYRWPRASAQHEVGHLDRMAAIDRRLAAFPGLYVTGSGFRGTGIPDCVADGRATAAKASAFRQAM